MTKTAVLIISLAICWPALAGNPTCRPKADGIDRIPKTGPSCPNGYFASGHCCEALHKYSPKAYSVIRGRACPPGTLSRGGLCQRAR